MRNRTAWNTAALCGMAMSGKLPKYEDVFPPRGSRNGQAQTPEQQEVALRLLAAAWGAVEAGP